MRKVVTSMLLVLVIAILPQAAFAAIKVTLFDGTNTLTATSTTPVRNFRLWNSSPAGQTTPLPILSCPTRPCIVNFPSGTLGTTPGAGDTFQFRDNCGTNSVSRLTCPTTTPTITSPVARVIKTDASTDKFEFKGIQITALSAPKTLTITLETNAGDYGPSLGNGQSITVLAAMNGTFNANQTSGVWVGTTPSCTLGTSTPCATLKVSAIVGPTTGTINCKGSNTLASVTWPPPAEPATACPVTTSAPSFNSTAGTFSASDSGKGTCQSTSGCSPALKAQYVLKFTAVNDPFSLTNSGVGAMGAGPENFGPVDLLVELGNELGVSNVYVPYSGQNENFVAELQPPLAGSTSRNTFNESQVPFAFRVFKVQNFVSSPSVTLVSTVSNDNDPALTEENQIKDNTGYLSFVPASAKLLFGDLQTLVYSFDFITGDCSAGSFRVKFNLFDPKTGETGDIFFFLGTDSSVNFRGDCEISPNASPLNGQNLVNNTDDRIDTTGLGGFCCTTFKKANSPGAFGKFEVKSISLVLDQGLGTVEPAPGDQQVVVSFAQVNTSIASFIAPGALVETSDLFLDGRSIRVLKTGCQGTCRQVELIITDDLIENIGDKITAKIDVGELEPDRLGSTYQAELCHIGHCFPNPGTFALKGSSSN